MSKMFMRCERGHGGSGCFRVLCLQIDPKRLNKELEKTMGVLDNSQAGVDRKFFYEQFYGTQIDTMGGIRNAGIQELRNNGHLVCQWCAIRTGQVNVSRNASEDLLLNGRLQEWERQFQLAEDRQIWIWNVREFLQVV